MRHIMSYRKTLFWTQGTLKWIYPQTTRTSIFYPSHIFYTTDMRKSKRVTE